MVYTSICHIDGNGFQQIFYSYLISIFCDLNAKSTTFIRWSTAWLSNNILIRFIPIQIYFHSVPHLKTNKRDDQFIVMTWLGTFLHFHANLPNIIMSQSVILKPARKTGRHCLVKLPFLYRNNNAKYRTCVPECQIT